MKIKYKELEVYLKSLQYEDFSQYGTIGQLVPCEFQNDIENFRHDKSKITLDTYIPYGTPFLCDSVGNDLSIMKLSRRSYTNPKGRICQAKYDRKIIEDCREVYGTCLNGCWCIPDRFLIKEVE